MILNNLKFDYWNKVVSTNIGNVLAAEMLLFSVDFACLAVTTICLGYFCRINLLRQFCDALRQYWLLIAAVAGSLISKVCFTIMEINDRFYGISVVIGIKS